MTILRSESGPPPVPPALRSKLAAALADAADLAALDRAVCATVRAGGWSWNDKPLAELISPPRREEPSDERGPKPMSGADKGERTDFDERSRSGGEDRH